MPAKTDSPTRDELTALLTTAWSFWQARVLLTAVELGLFSALLDGAKTAGEVAARIPADPRATETLLNALAGQGFLVKQQDTFRVKPSLVGALSPSGPDTVIPLLLHLAHLWAPWSTLTEVVRKGGKPPALGELFGDLERLRDFIGAMHALGKGVASALAARVEVTGRRSLLDVGGGSGVYTMALLRTNPGLRATLFDRPAVVEIARQKLEEEGLIDRVVLVKGDFYEDSLPAGHDVALLSAIIHQNNAEQNVALYRKVFDALLPGGIIVIRDYVMSEDHTQPAEGALFAVNMLVNTAGGGTYSFAEISRDLQAAGFTEARLLRQAEMDSIVTAVKPG